MRLAELVRSPWILATAGLVGVLLVRPVHHANRLSPPPIVDVQPTHELTMTIDDCASDVQTVDGKYVVTLRIPEASQCATDVRVYHLENDRLVSDRGN
ncbi:MAG TPA: hypothetical protein VGL61_00995 [Kofleriaceae bacterium]|jgi:hypothetical protein